MSEDEVYAGTDLLKRFCASCGKLIEQLSDIWVDSDEDCCVCAECKDKLSAEHPFPESHFRPASDYLIEDISALE